MAHTVVHFEMAVPNYESVAKWYADLFDWRYMSHSNFKYARVNWPQEAGVNGGGYMPANDLIPLGALLLYISTDDVVEHMERIVAAGGTAVGNIEAAPGVGIWWRFRDPAGNYMAIITPESTAVQS